MTDKIFQKRINPNKCLPPELIIESVDDILYRIGLSFDSLRDPPKRSQFNNPFIVFITLFAILSEKLITLTVNEENDWILKVIGDLGYLIGVRIYINIAFILTSILGLTSQWIYYYNYRNGIKPTFLRVFQMMSGLVSPKSLGLTDEQQIRKLCDKTKTLNSTVKFC